MSLGKLLLFFVVALSVGTATAEPFGPSASRGLLEDWRILAEGYRPFNVSSIWGSSGDLAMDVSKNTASADYSKVTVWKDYATIQENFEKVRDIRFVVEPGINKNLRRSTWMYPDDGCFARAQLMEDNLAEWGEQPTTKIFVFGDLLVKSPNAMGGSVGWWYHVAPIVSDGQKNYILDPAIDPLRPLEVNEWLARMGNPSKMKVSVCNTQSYTPYSDCYAPLAHEASTAMSDQTYFLSAERERIKRLGRDADQELGDNPPWLVNTPVANQLAF